MHVHIGVPPAEGIWKFSGAWEEAGSGRRQGREVDERVVLGNSILWGDSARQMCLHTLLSNMLCTRRLGAEAD